MAKTVRQRVLEIIAEQAVLDVSDLKVDKTPDDLGIDSLGLVEAIFALEEAFGIEVPFGAETSAEGILSKVTIDELVAMIEKLVAAKDV